MTLAVLLAIASSVKSGEISQSVDFRYAEHDTYWSDYNQFDPVLGTLTRVDISVSGTFVSNDVAFFNTSRTDNVSFTAFVNNQVNTDAGSTVFTGGDSSPISLPPLGEAIIASDYMQPYSLFSSYSDVGPWIGTGSFAPFRFVGQQAFVILTGGADDPRITTQEMDDPAANITGSETVTYFFQPAVPEPSSLVLSATAAFVVTGAGYIKRKRGK